VGCTPQDPGRREITRRQSHAPHLEGGLVQSADLARVSPLAHAHVTPNGSYFQSPRRRSDAAPEPVTA